MPQKTIFHVWQALILRSLREGAIGFWRNRFLSLTTILLGALILFLLNFVFAIKFYANYSLKNLESRADFTIPLREDVDSFRLGALQNELKNNFKVDMDLWPADRREDFVIPARLHIKFRDITQVEEVLRTTQKLTYDEVVGDWDAQGEQDFVNLIDKLLTVRAGVEAASVWLLILFMGGGFLLAVNTFRMMIFSRREEIFIARLVGATTKFIAGPFLVEGIMLGMFSSIIAIFTFIFILQKVTIAPGGEIFIYLWNTVFTWEILISGLVGFFGAWIAIKKYLFSPLSTKDKV